MESSMLTPVTTFPGFKTAAQFDDSEDYEQQGGHTYDAWMFTTARKLKPSSGSQEEEPLLTPVGQPSTSEQLNKWLNSTDAKMASAAPNSQLFGQRGGSSPATPYNMTMVRRSYAHTFSGLPHVCSNLASPALLDAVNCRVACGRVTWSQCPGVCWGGWTGSRCNHCS
jgi:hypothetical protein